MTFQLTAEQNAIIQHLGAKPPYTDGGGFTLIDALAGSSKTFSLLKGIEALPQVSILLCAFNKAIQQELTNRAPVMPRHKALHIKTFHSIGLQILKRHYPHLEVNKNASEELISQVSIKGTKFEARRVMVKLLRLAKEAFGELDPDNDQLKVIGDDQALFDKIGSAIEIDSICFTVCRAYEASKKLDKRQSIDFCDMVWAPVACKLAPLFRYQAIMVDELQDTSTVQWELISMLRAPNGRVIGVGDRHQQLYEFRGADGTAWRCFEANAPKRLPLTMTFRCAKKIVKRANEIVPALRARPDAPDGEEYTIDRNELPVWLAQKPEPSTFVLSRNNIELLRVAMLLWRNKIKFRLNAGQEIIEPLYEILNSLDLKSHPAFLSSLAAWRLQEIIKAEASGAVAWAERIEEQFEMLSIVGSYVLPNQIASTLAMILGLGDQAPTNCTLSTVHKAKGLEADRVFLLKQTFARYRERRDDDGKLLPVSETDLNIEYVAITRARHTLVWVNL